MLPRSRTYNVKGILVHLSINALMEVLGFFCRRKLEKQSHDPQPVQGMFCIQNLHACNEVTDLLIHIRCAVIVIVEGQC